MPFACLNPMALVAGRVAPASARGAGSGVPRFPAMDCGCDEAANVAGLPTTGAAAWDALRGLLAVVRPADRGTVAL